MKDTESVRKWLRVQRRLRIQPGDIYEDCAYHPCVCLAAVPVNWQRGWRARLHLWSDTDLTGVSLWDLSVRSCSARHCAPDILTPRQLLESLYQHAEDKRLYQSPDLQESLRQMRAGDVAVATTSEEEKEG